jgi:hypothetical protein
MPQTIKGVFAVADRTQVAAKGEIPPTMELLSGEQTQEKRSVIPGRTRIEQTEIQTRYDPHNKNEWLEGWGRNMKSATWAPCSEASINSELNHLREVRANLSECVADQPVNEAPPHMTMALSFVQLAIDALATYQVKTKTVAASK